LSGQSNLSYNPGGGGPLRYQVKLFARLKEHTGLACWEWDSERPLRGSQLLAAFFTRFAELDGLRGVTRLAVNRAFISDDPLLDPADELALIPPVSGG